MLAFPVKILVWENTLLTVQGSDRVDLCQYLDVSQIYQNGVLNLFDLKFFWIRNFFLAL